MRPFALTVLCALLFAACLDSTAPPVPDEAAVADRNMRNVARLTFDGDNGEAYFSPDGKRLIFQSSRGNQACDKIWTMNIDGSDKRMVSPGHGAHTCSFFLPGDSIVFASTSHLPGDCPAKPASPQGARYVWPL